MKVKAVISSVSTRLSPHHTPWQNNNNNNHKPENTGDWQECGEILTRIGGNAKWYCYFVKQFGSFLHN